MPSKKTEEKEKDGQTHFGPSSKGVAEMIEKMKQCCMSGESPVDCCSMMEEMRKKMREKCCGSKMEYAKTDNEQQKS